MLFKNLKLIIIFLLINFFYLNISIADIVKEFKVSGNDRISKETVELFSNIKINDQLNKEDINKVLKNLYDTNFFKDISISFKNNILIIDVVENPIIEEIEYKGIKAVKILNVLKENALIKSRSSYNEILLKKEKNRLEKLLKKIGYYDSVLNVYVKNQNNNLVNLTFDFNLGKKAKIKKISFVGNKMFKDSKLKRVIASSEYKYWKFLTGRKFLNEELVELDKRLLTNFYKNNGFYNVEVNSSFAKQINQNEFELIFNINEKNKIFFGNITLDLPDDFDQNNFKKINK